MAGAFKESAGSIGLRTQTIQMLRDDKYRLCEAYANGAIDDIEYSFLLRQAQRDMVALLAIEQLTGAISAPAITLSTDANSIEATQENIDNVNAKIRVLEKENALLDSKNPVDTKVIQENNRDIELHKETIKAHLDSIRNGTAGSSGLNKIAGMSNKSPVDIQNVAQSVRLIVNSLNEKDYTPSLCMMEYQRARIRGFKISDEIKKLCETFVEEAKNNNQHKRNNP